jgi:DnaK suppressor protein
MSASEPAKLATVIAKQPTASERKTLPEPEKPPRWPYEVGPQVQNEKLTAAQTREMKANLEEERDRLIQEITQLAGQNFTEFSASQSNRFGNHMADFASDSQMLETLLVQSGMEADRLRQVNEAIERIRRRRYGVCERCGGHIGWDRIQAKPFARYCIVCRAAFEQSAMRRRA